jgi:hypothetical protein
MNSKLFCTSCGLEQPEGWQGEVCEECEECYGTLDDAPEQFCNTCGADLMESGGWCQRCDGEL